MSARTLRPRTRLVVLGVVAAALALPAMAEVMTPPVEKKDPPKPVAAKTSEPPPPAYMTEPVKESTRPVHVSRLRAQCWQEGVKIIDQTDLEGLSLNAASRESSVSFKRRGDDGASVFLLPFADGLCLIQPADGSGG